MYSVMLSLVGPYAMTTLPVLKFALTLFMPSSIGTVVISLWSSVDSLYAAGTAILFCLEHAMQSFM